MERLTDPFTVRMVHRNMVSSEIQHFFSLKMYDSILYIEKHFFKKPLWLNLTNNNLIFSVI